MKLKVGDSVTYDNGWGIWEARILDVDRTNRMVLLQVTNSDKNKKPHTFSFDTCVQFNMQIVKRARPTMRLFDLGTHYELREVSP